MSEPRTTEKIIAELEDGSYNGKTLRAACDRLQEYMKQIVQLKRRTSVSAPPDPTAEKFNVLQLRRQEVEIASIEISNERMAFDLERDKKGGGERDERYFTNHIAILELRIANIRQMLDSAEEGDSLPDMAAGIRHALDHGVSASNGVAAYDVEASDSGKEG